MTHDAVEYAIGAMVAKRYEDECACLVQENAAGQVCINEPCEEHRDGS